MSSGPRGERRKRKKTGWAKRDGEREKIFHFQKKRIQALSIQIQTQRFEFKLNNKQIKDVKQHEMHKPIFLTFILWLNILF